MKNEKLKQFYEMYDMRDEVYAFWEQKLNEYALHRVFSKQDVTGIADAKAIFEKLKNDLRLDYEMKKQTSTRQNRPV